MNMSADDRQFVIFFGTEFLTCCHCYIAIGTSVIIQLNFLSIIVNKKLLRAELVCLPTGLFSCTSIAELRWFCCFLYRLPSLSLRLEQICTSRRSSIRKPKQLYRLADPRQSCLPLTIWTLDNHVTLTIDLLTSGSVQAERPLCITHLLAWCR